MEVLESVSAINENGISQKVTQKIVKNIKTSELKEIELTFLPKDCQCRIQELLNAQPDLEQFRSESDRKIQWSSIGKCSKIPSS